MKFILPRGLRDLNPDDYEMLEKIRFAFVETCRVFGFRLMEPSPIEAIETLEAKSGESIRQEIYCFRDKSDREIGLRFDLTIGITRWVTSRRDLSPPVKLGAFGGMWRYDEPQYGRYRWFYQWDAEVFGPSNVDADAEVVEFAQNLFENLGLANVQIKLGDRKIVEEYIRNKIGITENGAILDMLRALDKLGKKTEEEILNEYQAKEISRDKLQMLIRFGEINGEPESVLTELNSLSLRSQNDLTGMVDALKARRIRNLELDLAVVRGLDYYTGMVFEVFDKEDLQLGALAGGGRYDSLPEIFGSHGMGATGVAGGVERTILSLKKRKSTVGFQTEKPLVYIAYAGRESATAAHGLTALLRHRHIATEVELIGRSLRKQLETAASHEAAYAIIVGPREQAMGKIVLRDMKSGRETVETIEEAITKLNRH